MHANAMLALQQYQAALGTHLLSVESKLYPPSHSRQAAAGLPGSS